MSKSGYKSNTGKRNIYDSPGVASYGPSLESMNPGEEGTRPVAHAGLLNVSSVTHATNAGEFGRWVHEEGVWVSKQCQPYTDIY